ncbi:MAG: CPBP family intramembrane glutamic endopeptidase [Myxococcota bacterium]
MANPTDPLEDVALDALTVLFYLPVALGSLLYLFWSGGEFALFVRTLGEHPLRDSLAGAAVGLGVVFVTQFTLPRFDVGQRFGAALGRMIGRRPWLSCAVIAASSSVGEELLFRAVLQQRLGLAIATVLFAVAHFPVERDLWPWPLMALALGLAFGGLYEWSGAALAPIVAHAVINLLNLRFVGRFAPL